MSDNTEITMSAINLCSSGQQQCYLSIKYLALVKMGFCQSYTLGKVKNAIFVKSTFKLDIGYKNGYMTKIRDRIYYTDHF